MYQYKLTKIVFNEGTTFEPNNLTVIVGANNTGKTRILKEIASKTTTVKVSKEVIVESVEWSLPNSHKEATDSYQISRFQNEQGQHELRLFNPTLIGQITTADGNKNWEEWAQTNWNTLKNDSQWFIENYGNALVAFLTTENRLLLTKESPSPSHEREVSNLLQALYRSGKETETKIRKLVKDAFDKDIILDFTTLQKMLLRIGENFDEMPLDPREAAPKMLEFEKFDEQGDGLRSFVGIVVSLLTVKRGLFLIDEPETFLHPPQAFRVGEFIAQQSNNSQQIIVATHSADFLRGIISKNKNVSIIRIDRNKNTNSFKKLNSKDLKAVIESPLLSSARVLDGLFYTGVIVVEADSDARFYQAVSRKFNLKSDFHFVNADNKQTVPVILKLYKDLGVSCVGIVDFDVLNNTDEFRKQLEALLLEEEEFNQAIEIQKKIASYVSQTSPDERLAAIEGKLPDLQGRINDLKRQTFNSNSDEIASKEGLLKYINKRSQEISGVTKGGSKFKEYGRSSLSPELQTDFDTVAEICANKGLFINPLGELETMLIEQGIPYTTDKKSWIVQALELINNFEVNETIYPWKFIKPIHEKLIKR